jgi:hypothetical protein
MSAVIDVHTHMLNRDWLELLRAHGRPRYELRTSLDAPEGIFLDGAPFMTPQPGHFDYPYRIQQMDAARVDLAIISLTCPNVYWGRDVSPGGRSSATTWRRSVASVAHSLALLPWNTPRRLPELARPRPGRWASWCWRTSLADPHRPAVRAGGRNRPARAPGPGASDSAAGSADGAPGVQPDREHRFMFDTARDRASHVRRIPDRYRREADRLARGRRSRTSSGSISASTR